jgi:hypothetical protein
MHRDTFILLFTRILAELNEQIRKYSSNMNMGFKVHTAAVMHGFVF